MEVGERARMAREVNPTAPDTRSSGAWLILLACVFAAEPTARPYKVLDLSVTSIAAVATGGDPTLCSASFIVIAEARAECLYIQLISSMLRIVTVGADGDHKGEWRMCGVGGRNKFAALQLAGIEGVNHCGGRHRWRPYWRMSVIRGRRPQQICGPNIWGNRLRFRS